MPLETGRPPFFAHTYDAKKFEQEYLGVFAVENFDNRMFKPEELSPLITSMHAQPQVETVFQKLDELEKKLDSLTSLLKFVVGNHVLINGRWVKVEGIS